MRKTINLTVAVAIATSFLLVPSACFYDNEEELYGTGGGCDTTAVSYSQDVQAILANNCTSCHAPGGEKADLPANTHPTAQALALQHPMIDRINNPTSPMPPSGLMDPCLRAKLEAWVNAGAPNN
jgi:mono/diheme cytochrome c family protein